MHAVKRRQAILECLREANHPVSAAALASRFSVSRQVIVGDVALLRASGANISATPRGYLMTLPSGLLRQVACRHGKAGAEAELCAIVDQGCTVLNVIVEHPVYGQLTGSIRASNRQEVRQFLDRSVQSEPLSHLTEGSHLHTLACPDEAAFQRVLTALRDLGTLAKG